MIVVPPTIPFSTAATSDEDRPYCRALSWEISTRTRATQPVLHRTSDRRSEFERMNEHIDPDELVLCGLP